MLIKYMREIKFRVWVKRTEKPVWASYIKLSKEKFPGAYGGSSAISNELGKEVDDFREEYIKEHGDLFQDGDDASQMLYDGFIISNGGVNFPEGGWDINGENDKDSILMQYTGIKDKNKIEIYEGDICNIYGFGGNVVGVKAIRWDSYNNVGAGFNYRDDGHFLEVIGNVYQNPELIK